MAHTRVLSLGSVAFLVMLTFGNFGNAAQKLNDHLEPQNHSTQFVRAASAISARQKTICLFAAAKRFSTFANNVSLVSSKIGPSASFVEIDHSTSRVLCVIDETAKIISLARVVYKS